jgi:hypothetical protein
VQRSPRDLGFPTATSVGDPAADRASLRSGPFPFNSRLRNRDRVATALDGVRSRSSGGRIPALPAASAAVAASRAVAMTCRKLPGDPSAAVSGRLALSFGGIACFAAVRKSSLKRTSPGRGSHEAGRRR